MSAAALKHPGQERLERWQAWQFAGGWRTSPWYTERVDGMQLGDGLVATDEEALVTDRFVRQLPQRILRTVRTVYLDRVGNSREGYARRLGVSVSTLDSHLTMAYQLVDGMWQQFIDQRRAKAAAARTDARTGNFETNEKAA